MTRTEGWRESQYMWRAYRKRFGHKDPTRLRGGDPIMRRFRRQQYNPHLATMVQIRKVVAAKVARELLLKNTRIPTVLVDYIINYI